MVGRAGAVSLSADQRVAIADFLFAALKPLDRYAILPGPRNRIVDLDLADERVIDVFAEWLGEVVLDEREQLKRPITITQHMPGPGRTL